MLLPPPPLLFSLCVCVCVCVCFKAKKNFPFGQGPGPNAHLETYLLKIRCSSAVAVQTCRAVEYTDGLTTQTLGGLEQNHCPGVKHRNK
jgi:hypothetical protein